MKIGFIIPILEEYDLDVAVKNIERACADSGTDYDIIFALNARMDVMFTRIRNLFSENAKVKAFMTDRFVSEHKLITFAMKSCEDYGAVVIYSGKEETNVDVIKAFIASHQAGNKIVYLKKVYRGFANIWQNFKNLIYRLGVFVLGVFKDIVAENDIQLLDSDVVKTINQLPTRNQLLRTLDSLIYYNTDIVHLQVDPNEYINPIYTEKIKSYYTNASASYIFLVMALLSATASILLLSLQINIHYLFHLGMWSMFAISFFTYIVLNAKKRLSLRVGKEFDPNELKSIEQKIEYYNF